MLDVEVGQGGQVSQAVGRRSNIYQGVERRMVMGDEESSLGHMPTEGPKTWEFDAEVTRVFEDMLERSIPQYGVMREAVTAVGMHFVQGKGRQVLDLGCSRGSALAPFVERCGAYASYVGVDSSSQMVSHCRERFKLYEYSRLVTIQQMDLRTDFPMLVGVDLVLVVLSLQFIPVEYRQEVLRKAFGTLRMGGALILVEKVLGNSGEINEMMVLEYLSLKADHGYTDEEIARKKLSLEGVLVPLTAAWNEQLLKEAGFKHVDVFWRWMNFCGWVAIA